MTVIKAKSLDLTFQTNDGPVQALSDVSLDINKGDFVSFIGPSGCGKTTFLRVIAALERWTEELRHEAADARDIDPEALEPILVQTRKINPRKDEGALMLSLLLPTLLVVMCVLGAFFPAVDLTAGRRAILAQVRIDQVRGQTRTEPRANGGCQSKVEGAISLGPTIVKIDFDPAEGCDG